jgi:hypothetical protein
MISLLFIFSLLINYNLRIINTKINLLEEALQRPEFNLTQKLNFYRDLKSLQKDRYIAIITENLE